MGKRIIQQARGRGGPRYLAKRKAYNKRIEYPNKEGVAKVIKLIGTAGHTAPLAKLQIDDVAFYIPAFKNMSEGYEIKIGKIEGEPKEGDIARLGELGIGERIYNIEVRPGDGGKLIRAAGSYGIITKKERARISVMMPSKKEKWFDRNCRATKGIIAGHGRLEKPYFKAGKKYYEMKAKGKLWPRTSALKMNVIDHPFGSGRGKNISHGQKGKIPKRNAPPGARVGTLRPSRTGRRKK